MKDVSFTAKIDGSVQKYVEILPGNFKETEEHNLLIGLHGRGSDRWQYAKQDRGECKGSRDIAAKYNMVFISPDYRATASWMNAKAEADLLQIIAELKIKYKIGKVFLVGGSMGAMSVLVFAMLHPDLIAGVASNNGIADIFEFKHSSKEGEDTIIKAYGGTKEEVPEEYRKRSVEPNFRKLTMPVSFTTSGKDTSTPPESILRLYKKLEEIGPENVFLIHRENEVHQTSYQDTCDSIEFVIKRVINKKLRVTSDE